MKQFKLISALGLAVIVVSRDTITAPKETMVRYGYEVDVVNTEDKGMSTVKHKYGAPTSVRSCHTAIVADYIVEGHVPARVVGKLLAEKPAIDGIAMAGMPSGSPGMLGRENTAWKIYSLNNGKVALHDKL